MMNTMINKKLSTEELAMVNGGENYFVQVSKQIWGMLTLDPEAIAVAKLINQYNNSKSTGTVVNYSPE